MTICDDCPTTTPPPTCPDPLPGSNCCLQVRYTCIAGVWTLDAVATGCVDNALCSAFLQICNDTEFYYEKQNGCVCFGVPVVLCDPNDVGCECGTTTTTTPPPTTTTTTPPPTTTTTTTTPPPTTTTTTPPPFSCGTLATTPAGGTWNLSNTGPFPVGQVDQLDILVPGDSGGAYCCYQITLEAFANATFPAGTPDLKFASISVSVVGLGPTVVMYTTDCGVGPIGSNIGDSRTSNGSLSILQTVFVCVQNALGVSRPYVRWSAQLNNNTGGGAATLIGSFQQTVAFTGNSCSPPP